MQKAPNSSEPNNSPGYKGSFKGLYKGLEFPKIMGRGFRLRGLRVSKHIHILQLHNIINKNNIYIYNNNSMYIYMVTPP